MFRCPNCKAEFADRGEFLHHVTANSDCAAAHILTLQRARALAGLTPPDFDYSTTSTPGDRIPDQPDPSDPPGPLSPFDTWARWIRRRAARNLEKWGVQDFETLGLAIAEESGELAQAILQHKHENGERSRITQETLDLAALCVQVLVSMRERHGAENLQRALDAEWDTPAPTTTESDGSDAS